MNKSLSFVLCISLIFATNISAAKEPTARISNTVIDEVWEPSNCKLNTFFAIACLEYIDALLSGAAEDETYFLLPTSMFNPSQFEILVNKNGKPLFKDNILIAVKVSREFKNKAIALAATNLQEFNKEKKRIEGRFAAYTLQNPAEVKNYDFAKAKKAIIETFLNKKNELSMTLSFLNKFLSSTGDPYALVRPAEFEPEEDWGLGLRQRIIDGKMKIVTVQPNSKMDKLGISVGDEVLSIGKIPAIAENVAKFDEIVTKTKGKSPIRIEFRAIETGKHIIVDEKINFQEVPTAQSYEYNVDEKKIGTLVINTFMDNKTFEKVEKEIHKLIKNKITHLILDLRENSGGLNDEAASVLGLFIGNNVSFMKSVLLEDGIAYENLSKNLKPEDLISRTLKDKLVPNHIPIVVLTSYETASAAELVSMVISESERGWLVGQRTSGKGIEQQIVPYLFGEGLELTYTVSRYENMHGFSPHLIGIKPDFEVSSPLQGYDGEIMAERFIDVHGKAFAAKNTEMTISPERAAKREQIEQCSKDVLNNKKISATTARWLKDQQLRKATAVVLCNAANP